MESITSVEEASQSDTEEEIREIRDPPASSCSQPDLHLEEKMRRKLCFFFMNPIEKWRARRKFPYKFVVQVIKIILVTLQLCLFAHNQYKHVNYTWDNRIAFSHLFLKGWDSSMEINAYPPGAGPLAVYQVDDFYDTIDYAYNGYSNLSNAIGIYSYDSIDNKMVPPKLCLSQYKEAEIFGYNQSYTFNSEIDETCINITQNGSQSTGYSSRRLLESTDININFAALVMATLTFSVKTVHFKLAGPITPPDCYRFEIVITFDNRDHDGQMLLDLDAEVFRLHCNSDSEYITDMRIDKILHSILNIFVIIICSTSLILCCRALYRAHQLKIITVQFFRKLYNKELSSEGKMEFLNMWYVMIIVNDVLIIMGSAIKEQIENKQFAHDQWNMCAMFLGIGNLLVWFGVLRYLGFFQTYNVVILTLKNAAPKIMRFSICALLLYAGFTFCGWLVLGPYHMKFRSLAMTSECLFSLVNGDDMFATFSSMSAKSATLWWFSRIYLYSFISLYIYVVLSLFISVIMDAYDTIKRHYSVGFPKNDLQQFIGQVTPDQVSSGMYRSESSMSINLLRKAVCCWSNTNNPYSKLGSRHKNQTHTGTI